MNKKFMVVALMAALSTVATASLEDKVNANKVAIETVLGSVVDLEQKTEENRVIAGQAQNNAANALIQNSKQDKDIAALGDKLNGKADVDFVTGQVNDAYNELDGKVNDKLAGKVDKEDFGKLDNEVGGLVGKVEAIDQDKNRLEAEMNDKLNGKADVDFVTGQVNDAYNELDGKLNSGLAGKVDKEDFGKLDNEVGALTGKVEAMNQDKDRLEAEMNDKLNGKADVDFVTGQVNDAYNELDGKLNSELAGKVDKEDFNRLDNEVGQITSDVEAIKGDLNNKVSKDELGQELDNRLNAAVQGTLDGKIDAAVEETLAGKADKVEINDLHAKVDAVELENERVNAEQNETIGKLEQKTEENRVIATNAQNNAAHAIIKNNEQDKKIEALQQNFAQYDGRLSGLEKKVDHLDDKMNKGLSLMAAMNAVDFQNVQTGEMALGAGIGHYGNAQSVALGVAYSPVEDLTVNAKYSITAGDVDSFALGAGATYKFKVGR